MSTKLEQLVETLRESIDLTDEEVDGIFDCEFTNDDLTELYDGDIDKAIARYTEGLRGE